MDHPSLNFNARLDPITSPDGVSSHLHTFVGSNAISSSQDYNSIRSSSACTTSGADAEKSSYWAPTLFLRTGNDFTAFNLTNVNTYYLQRGKMSLKVFPEGLRMIAGNSSARGLAATKQLQGAVSFVCLNYNGGSSQSPLIPNKACPDGLRAQIVFPSCWDGKNLDSADHKSHMAYPLGDNADNGDACPSTHPIRFITLFYEFIWNVRKAANNEGWVLANGDMEGYSYHADFMNGWDVNVLQSAINQCTTNLFNNLEGFSPFAASLSRKEASSCKVNPAKVSGLNSEVVSGKLAKLPGCNTIFNGALEGKGGFNSTEMTTVSSSSSISASHSSSSTLSSVSASNSKSSTSSSILKSQLKTSVFIASSPTSMPSTSRSSRTATNFLTKTISKPAVAAMVSSSVESKTHSRHHHHRHHHHHHHHHNNHYHHNKHHRD